MDEMKQEETQATNESATSPEATAPTGVDAKPKKGKKKLLITLGIVAAAIVAAYLGVGGYYTSHYLPNTTINGMACANKTVDELEQLITDEIDLYTLTIAERGGGEETINGTDFDLHMVFDGTLDNILAEQSSFLWIKAFWTDSEYNPGKVVAYDEELLAEILADLDCMDEEGMTLTADAYIEYDEGTFVIQPAVYGTYLEAETLLALVDEAVLSLTESIDLEELDCYEDPLYTEDSEETIAACETMNSYLVDITYDMLDIDNVTISKDTMSTWIVVDEEMEVSFDKTAIASYVSDFADKYDTSGKAHTLKTTWGSTVTISTGSYGWKLNQDGEVSALIADMEGGEAVTREPTYSKTASSHGSNDYGSTYVEINLTAQHLYFYKNGSLIVSTDFVSGNVSAGNSTPTGIYSITYTQKDATLRGDDYETPVSYWMPFNGGVGMHDATWRSVFGGTIYKTNGSHGCINLPLSAAKTIFENIKTGDPVLVYTLAGTEQSSSANSSDSADEEDTDSEE